MTESPVKICSMILMGKNKIIDPTLCEVPVPDLVTEIYVSFPFLWHI